MLRKLLAVALVLVAIQKWPEIKTHFLKPPNFATEANGKVVLYSTAWCGYCEKARNLMKENDINFVELDIEKSVEGNRQHQQLGGGGVPLLLIGGEVVRGYAPDRILELAKRQ